MRKPDTAIPDIPAIKVKPSWTKGKLSSKSLYWLYLIGCCKDALTKHPDIYELARCPDSKDAIHNILMYCIRDAWPPFERYWEQHSGESADIKTGLLKEYWEQHSGTPIVTNARLQFASDLTAMLGARIKAKQTSSKNNKSLVKALEKRKGKVDLETEYLLRNIIENTGSHRVRTERSIDYNPAHKEASICLIDDLKKKKVSVLSASGYVADIFVQAFPEIYTAEIDWKERFRKLYDDNQKP